MKLRMVMLIALCCSFQAAVVSYAQSRSNHSSFDPAMSLEQTLDWVGKGITDVRTVTSTDGRSSQRLETSYLKGKGCTFSYWSGTQMDSAPASTNVDVRELWTINLAALNPRFVRASQSQWETFARVSFSPNGFSNAINTRVFHNDRLYATQANRRWGSLNVRDLRSAEEVVVALKHAIELCQQGGAPVK